MVEAAPVLGDSVSMKEEDAALVRATENQILQLKLQIADLELQKNGLFASVREQHNLMMEQVKKIAESYGIDVEGVRDTSRWNLDTASMVFTRVTQ